MKRLLTLACASLALAGCAYAQTYKDTNASPQERAKSIVAEMTLEEKVALMQHDSPAVPRLGIKAYNWWNEALHGVARAGLATVFPQPIGMAASFDDALLFQVFEAASDEARAKNQRAKANGGVKHYQGLTFWTPNINIYRDPRWGRGHETYGEDPYLTAQLGKSVVRGLQGDNYEGTKYTGPDAPKYYKAQACAKHFAVHSGPEWNRHYYNAEVSDRDLYETYLPAFKALVQDANVKEVMCAYNRLDGQPCCGSSPLLQKILRDDWGYQGLVTSDCWAIRDFYDPNAHRTDYDQAHAVAKAVRAGTDLECGPNYGALVDAVAQGLVDEATIDESITRLMAARYELGEMDDDALVSWTQIPYSVVASAEHAALAKQMALESIVLLKNDNGALPLAKKAKIGLIGPNANDSVMQWGNYNGFPASTSTLLGSLEKQYGKNNVIYVPGLDHTANMEIVSAFGNTRASNGKPGFDAKFWNTLDSKAVKSNAPDVTFAYTTPINLTTAGATVWAPGVNLGRFTAEFTTTLVPDKDEKIAFSVQDQGHLTLYVDGKKVFKGGNMKSAQAYILPVEAGKEYDIKAVFHASEGDCASLNFDFGTQTPMDIEAFVSPLAQADVIVFAGGLSPMLEGEEMQVEIPGFRGGDRETIELPIVQQQALQAIAKFGKPVVLVSYSGSAVALTSEDAPADAIVQAWYPGQAGGDAVVDVLTGKYNPSGKLPLTFYASTSELPNFLDYNMYGHTYRYYDGTPLFAFGHGLSYTDFEYGKATIGKNSAGQPVLRFPLSNIGKKEGTEIVQLYVSRPDDVMGPRQQLRGFKRVSLKPHQTSMVEFELTPEVFEWYDPSTNAMQPLPGEYILRYGTSSANTTPVSFIY